jgi:hypothetical protein
MPPDAPVMRAVDVAPAELDDGEAALVMVCSLV